MTTTIQRAPVDTINLLIADACQQRDALCERMAQGVQDADWALLGRITERVMAYKFGRDAIIRRTFYK